ncbi:hypothetical protein HK102_007623, partial [Quaeritorhiza haematococci]
MFNTSPHIKKESNYTIIIMRKALTFFLWALALFVGVSTATSIARQPSPAVAVVEKRDIVDDISNAIYALTMTAAQAAADGIYVADQLVKFVR